MKKQWHPLFVHLMRLLVGEWYAIDPEVPVSDLPRRGDMLIVRREGTAEPPFRGLWSHLRELNVIEFKGPTDHPDVDDLELLMAVGAGLTAKITEERKEAGRPGLKAREVAFWYLAPSLGDTFLYNAKLRGPVQYESAGLWLGTGYGHPLRFVAYRELPAEEDGLPLFLLDRQRPVPAGLGAVILSRQELVRQFGWLVRSLQPILWGSRTWPHHPKPSSTGKRSPSTTTCLRSSTTCPPTR